MSHREVGSVGRGGDGECGRWGVWGEGGVWGDGMATKYSIIEILILVRYKIHLF